MLNDILNKTLAKLEAEVVRVEFKTREVTRHSIMSHFSEFAWFTKGASTLLRLGASHPAVEGGRGRYIFKSLGFRQSSYLRASIFLAEVGRWDWRGGRVEVG